MIKQIIKDENVLRQKCNKVETDDEAKQLVEDLIDTLSADDTGVGLSAPQLGVLKQVCVINVKEPVVLINPRIVETQGTTGFVEGCLSFPGQNIKTQRHVQVLVECDNYESKLLFGSLALSNIADAEFPGTKEYHDLLESVAIQHEISHLEGKLMFDFAIHPQPIRRSKKYGRNEKINIKNPTTEEVIEQIKYKKTENYLKDNWKIIE